MPRPAHPLAVNSTGSDDAKGRRPGVRPRSRPGSDNLPLPLGPLVGRQDDLKQVGDLLPRHRIVTLAGGPGMGKTRLALEVARSSLASYPDGVWLVALAPVSAPELVSAAVASVLSVREADRAKEEENYDDLTKRIGDGRMLIVLDNCEHLVDACAHLALALLEACPNVVILATSQERLSVPGEHVWPVRGLAVPDLPNELATQESEGLDEDIAPGLAAGAVQLFDERARAADPRFVLTPDIVGSVVDICQKLDGIPLAIELAAARVNMFAPAEIAGRLDDRFGFLTGGQRTGVARHETLRAAVDWSYDLLSEPEQALLRRLSVFVGGATLDAIEQICSGGDVVGDECLALMTRLVARSLVVATTTPAGTRYQLLETIRLYGRDRLAEAGELTEVAVRHVRWCVDQAETAEPHLTGPAQRQWLARLAADQDNLRAAMTWSLEQGPTHAALRLAGSLTMYWRLQGNFREGFDWLSEALAVSGDAPTEYRAKAAWGRALMALMLARWDVARSACQASLDLWQELDNPSGVARSLLLIASRQDVGHTTTDNVALLQQAIALARHVGDGWCLAQALAQCGGAFGQMGTAAARPVLEEAVEVARSTGDEQSLVFALVSLGQVVISLGDYEAAEALLDEVGATSSGRGPDAYEVAFARIGLAEIATGRGDYELAHSLLDEARTSSSEATQVTLLAIAGDLALAEGDVAAAEHHFGESLRQSQAWGGTSPDAIRGLGEVALAMGDASEAQTRLSEALELATAMEKPPQVARALYFLGQLARFEGDDAQAAPIHRQALAFLYEAGDRVGLAMSLEALAGLAVRKGQAEQAARVFGFTRALREAKGYARPVPAEPQYQADVAAARQDLGDERFEASLTEGATLSLDVAVSYLSKGKGARAKRPASGLSALTDAERQVADLAAQGLTNVEIAERLFVSIHTVKTHLRRSYTKLAISSRSELAGRLNEQSF